MNPTGLLTVPFGGRDYALRLTWAGMAQLQDLHPDTVGAMLTGRDVVPSMRFALDAVRIALIKGGTDATAAADIADEMMTADPGLIGRLLGAAFPSDKGAPSGNGEAPQT